MEIASWLGPYAGGTEYDEGRPYISVIDGPGGPIITADHPTRDSPRVCVCVCMCVHSNRPPHTLESQREIPTDSSQYGNDKKSDFCKSFHSKVMASFANLEQLWRPIAVFPTK